MSKQIELENPDLKQQINFIGELMKIILQCSLSEERPFDFSQNSVTVVRFSLTIDYI